MAKKEVKKDNQAKNSYFKDMKAELKKVIWPTPKQLFNNTVAVLLIVIITAVIVFVLDIAFESMNKYGIDKVKQVVSNSSMNEITENEIDNTENVTLEEDVVENDTTEENVAE